MSITWTVIAIFLYIEITIVLLMVLPLFSATKWQRFFKSRFLTALTKQAQIYFYLLLGILVLFLLDALREMNKYSTKDEDVTLNLGMHHSLRLFRAQRNFYICGFAIYFTFVIRRLVNLISLQATLIAQAEASMKQAQSATSAARLYMDDKKDTKKSDQDTSTDDNTIVTDLQKQIKDLTAELTKEKKDKEALKSQAESLNREYDRLTEEFSKLQNKTVRASGGSGDKSD